MIIAEQLAIVEKMIEELRWARNAPDNPEHKILTALTQIAKDLRARQDRAPGVVEHQIESRIISIVARKQGGVYPPGPMIALAEEVMGCWPTIKQALARFGALEEVDR